MFNAICVKHRVPIPLDLLGIPANLPIIKSDIDMTRYYPNTEDDICLFKEYHYLASKVLVEYVEELSWAKSFVNSYMEHPYMDFTKNKSAVVCAVKNYKQISFQKITNYKSQNAKLNCIVSLVKRLFLSFYFEIYIYQIIIKFPLGINDNDETSNEGMHEILKEAHKVVPGHSHDHQMKTFFVGDLKTVERAQNTQLEHRKADTPSKRFEGLIPALADFHTFGNFLAVRNC